jgi:predicted dinucleotide-binding enzyme
MRLAIIGTGNVGKAIGTGLQGKGHDITFGTRNLNKPGPWTETGAKLALPADAAANADIVILALPWGAAQSAVQGLGPLAGQVVIDCMNPLGMVGGALGLMLGHSTSGGEMVQSWLPQAHVVKTLNQVGAEIIAQNAALPLRPVMFMAGNDSASKTKSASLLADLGFQPQDSGDLTKSRLLEPLAMLWINQAIVRGKGRGWAFACIENLHATH